jgi:translation initiation factor 4E
MQVLALVGDQLDYGDNICGAVLSIRFNEDIVSVWNRNASDHQVVIITDPIFLCACSCAQNVY